jgi:4-hydroxythreonine-4-phosphate dehydrogenase
VVTGPVHKGIINQAGVSFSGHTEFFAQQSGTADVVMLLATEAAGGAGDHPYPLAYVAMAITEDRLGKVIRILMRISSTSSASPPPHLRLRPQSPRRGRGPSGP